MVFASILGWIIGLIIICLIGYSVIKAAVRDGIDESTLSKQLIEKNKEDY